MSTETSKATPAYTTYTAFTNLINDLRENDVPSHITRSVVKGSNSGKAMSTAQLYQTDPLPIDLNQRMPYSKNLHQGGFSCCGSATAFVSAKHESTHCVKVLTSPRYRSMSITHPRRRR